MIWQRRNDACRELSKLLDGIQKAVHAESPLQSDGVFVGLFPVFVSSPRKGNHDSNAAGPVALLAAHGMDRLVRQHWPIQVRYS